DAGATDTVKQSGDQRIAHDQAGAALVAQPIQRMPREKPDDVPKVRPVVEGRQQRRNVRLPDHHAAENHELPARWPDAGEVVAELAAIERKRSKGPPANRG